jgi:hypothetical protein
VWLGSGVNAYQFIDCRFDHQVVALKKGLQPIQYAGDFKLLVGDSTLLMQDPVTNIDSTVKASPVLMESTSKIANANPKNALLKPKMQAKTGKSKPKMNNKPKNNSLIKKNKTAKALMPKQSKSPTKNN